MLLPVKYDIKMLAYCKAQAYEEKKTILFFVYFGTHNNKFHTIYKQTSVFVLLLLKIVILYTISVCYAWVLAYCKHLPNGLMSQKNDTTSELGHN
jgi:hypothetical protein